MRKMNRLLAAIIILSGAAVSVAADKEADVTRKSGRFRVPFGKDCTFHVGFDDGSPNADMAAGNKEGRYGGRDVNHKFPGEPVFVEGIRGKAFQIGRPNQMIHYKGASNIQHDEGTFVFWLQSDKWNLNDRSTDERIINYGGGMVYSWMYFDLWLWQNYKVVKFGGFDTRRWNMFAITWKGQGPGKEGERERPRQCYTYVNGKPAEKNDNFVCSIGAGGFNIGQPYGSDKYLIAIDEITIYNRMLSDAEIARIYHEVARPANDPMTVIPPTKSPPAIDGKLDEGEWDKAAQVSGLLSGAGQPAPTQGFFQLMYDAGNLYVAYQGPIPDDVRRNLHTRALRGFLRQQAKEPGLLFRGDDRLEVAIAPNYLDGPLYRLQSNNLGVHQAKEDGDKDADVSFETASKVDIDNGWVMEWKIPLAEIGMTGKPTPREKPFGLNLRRAWKLLEQHTDSWAWGRYNPGTYSFYPSLALGRAVLGSENDLTLRMEEFGPIADRRLPVKVKISNPSHSEAKAVVRVTNDTREVNLSLPLTIAAGASEQVSQTLVIDNPATSSVTVALTTPAKPPETLAAGVIRFWQEQSLETTVKYYPSHDVMEVELDMSLLRDVPPEELRAASAIMDGARKLASAVKEDFTLHRGVLKLNTSKVKAGKYAVLTEVFRGREKVAEAKKGFEKRPLPEWYNNNIGISDKVPPPYEPVKVSRSGESCDISCWGRLYRFDKSLLPTQVVTQGSEILSGPFELVLETADGRKAELARGAPIVIDSTKEARVTWHGEKVTGDIKTEISGWMDYDGFMWITIEVSPEKDLKIKSLIMKIPFRKEWATLVNNYNYSMKGTGATPEKPEQRSGYAWLGNEVGGIQKLGLGTMIVPEENRTVMEGRLITEEEVISQPKRFEFGLVATPIRLSAHLYDNLEEMADMNPVVWGYGNYQPHKTDWGNPLAWPSWAYGHGFRRGVKNKFYPEGRESDAGPYVMFEVCGAGMSEVGNRMMQTLDYWRYEWVRDVTKKMNPGQRGAEVTPQAKSWQDFFLWCYDEMYKRHRYTGLYYDVSMPNMNNNPYATGGGENPLLAARNIVKRMYTMLRLREPEGGIRYHESGTLNGALLGFQEQMADGENWFSIIKPDKPEYYNYMSLSMFRAEYIGRNFGPINWWLPQPTRAFNDYMKASGKKITDIYKDPDREARWIAGMPLAHNSGLWAAYIPGSWTRIREALQKYALSNHRYDFFGYWRQKFVEIEPADENLVVSIYKAKVKGPRGPLEGGKDAENNNKVVELPRRAMLILFNNSDWEGLAKLTVDWEALGFDPENATVENPAFGKPVQLQGKTIAVPITARDVRVIGIRKQ